MREDSGEDHMPTSRRTRLGGRHLACMMAALLLTGCESVRFYTQLAAGQLEVLRARDRVDELLARADLPAGLRLRLQFADGIIGFAGEALGLPVGDSYSSYADLGREHALWNVYAAPEFSTRPRTWCYPIAGCASYRGYFSSREAQAYGAGLQAAGLDVHVAGVRAYSTLGWFSDPLLNTFLFDADVDLAALLFHELAHQVLYVPGDTAFNEGFASFVEQEGLRRWAAHAQDPGVVEEALRRHATRQRFVHLVAAARSELDAVYAAGLGAERMRAEKQAVLARLRARFDAAAEDFPELQRYRAWIHGELNNAKLATVATYHDWLPAFAALLRRERGDLPAFYAACRAISRQPAADRRTALEHLAAANAEPGATVYPPDPPTSMRSEN